VLTPAGDGTDVVARAVAAKLSARFGQTFVIENRTGGGGLIAGNEALVKSAPDGYTLAVGHTGSHGISPAVYTKLTYDVKKDQTPISLISRTPNVFVINPSLPIKSVEEFIAYAKTRPKQLNFGSGGNASSAHMSGELFKNMAHVDVVHVPYRGGSLALADLVAGQVQFFIGNIPPALPYIASGKLRALAVTSDKRWPDLPSVPTMDESGLRGYETWGWAALYGPAGLPPAITRTLSTEVANAVKSPELSERLLKQGLEPIGSTPEELAAFMDKDIARWKKVAADSHISLD
jgi:tripartite-type tricarboxylate transporter receptor subunit TctC